MEQIMVERAGSTLSIVLNDPESGNLITAEMGEALIALLDGIDGETKLVRLSSAGPDFCRGRKSPPLDRATATALEYRRVVAEGPLRLYTAFKTARAPIVGVVQGKAFGVGFALAALCDITFAADDATFAIPELAHGIVPTLVMSALIGRVPEKAIAGLVLRQNVISAAKAEALGVVTTVVPAARLAAEADATIELLGAAPLDAVHAIKEYLRTAPRMDPQSATAYAAALISTVLSSRRGH
jgi:enoyl-CoA hydratase